MSGTFTSLVILESVLTAAAVVMFVYRSMLDMKEEDRLMLTEPESVARTQATIRHRVTVLSTYIKAVAVLWSLLLVVIFGVWVAHGLNLI